MASKSVKLNVAPLRAFRNTIKNDLRGSGSGEIDKALKQWAARYYGFARKRFVQLSRSGGGGEWPPLKPATIAARRFGGGQTVGGARKQALSRLRTTTNADIATSNIRKLARISNASGNVAILRDTGTLLNALSPGSPGSQERRIDGGIRVGYGGPTKHPKGRATIFDIARFHQTGAGHLPRRPTTVEPDQRTIDGMKRDMLGAINALGRRVERLK